MSNNITTKMVKKRPKLKRGMSLKDIPEIFLRKTLSAVAAVKSPNTNSMKSFSTHRVPYLNKINVNISQAAKTLGHFCVSHEGVRPKGKHVRASSYADKNSSLTTNPIFLCFDNLKQVLNLFLEEREFTIASNIYRLLAEVAELSHDYHRSIKYFCQIETIQGVYGKRLEQAKAFESIGRCYIKLKDYNNALKAYKQQLRLGWLARSKNVELAAYDNMGVAYFYLGDLEGAQYYHERMIGGILEPPKSLARVMCTRKIKKAKKEMMGRVPSINVQFKYTQIMQMVTIDETEKSNLLDTELKLRSKEGETPRITSDNPVELASEADLPSPRKLDKMYGGTIFTKVMNNIKASMEFQLKRELATKLAKTALSDKSKVMMTPIYSEKEKEKMCHVASTMNQAQAKSAVSGQKRAEPKPKLYISHLSSERRASNYYKFEEKMRFVKACKDIKKFPEDLVTEYVGRQSLFTPKAKTSNKKASWG